VDEVHPMGSYSKKKLSTKMVKSGYYCGVDMQSSLLIAISFLTCIF
jgi:hypothetical protein